MKLNYTFSKKEQLDYLHDKSIEVLSKVGIAFEDEESREILKKHGVKIENSVAFFDDAIVKKALDTVPKEFKWYSRNLDYITIGDKIPKNISTFGPMYVFTKGKYTLPSSKDFINAHILNETSEIIDAGSANVLDTSFVDRTIREEYKMANTLQYSTKPLNGLCNGKESSQLSIKMTREFYDSFDDRCLLTSIINSSSPLKFSPAMCQALVTYAKENQANVISTGGMAAMTAPPSIAGQVIQGHAERLAGIVLTQLVREGSPVVMGTNQNASDLRYMSVEHGTAETTLFTLTGSDLSNYYNIPLRSGSGSCDAKEVDYQAGVETFMNLFITYLSGCDFILHSLGAMDTINSFSYEKFILDEECVRLIKRILRGYELNDETILMDKIQKVGHGGDYLERTQNSYIKDFYLSKLFNKNTHNNWISSGSKSVVSRAVEEYEKRIKEFKKTELSKTQEKILLKYLDRSLLFNCS